MSAAVDLALDLLRALEARAPREQVEQLFHPDVEQLEFPNLLFPKLVRRDRAELLASGDRGRQVLSAERYQVLRVVGDETNAALEVEWTGTLAVPLGHLGPGDQLRAHLAMFFGVANGRIRTLHNYDCYEPLPKEPGATAVGGEEPRTTSEQPKHP